MRYLKKFGIPLRTEDDAHALNKGQVDYGEKRRRNKKQEHQRELQNIRRILELRTQGHSYHQIASILTTMGIPTKNHRRRWSASKVMKILKRHSQSEH